MAHGKIRALHPEFFSDDDLAEVSIEARLLFAGLWCFACDNGHVPDKSKQIKRWIYATDDVNAAELLRELESVEVIERSDGWITVTNLGKRQRIDWRYFKTCERDDCDRPKKDSKPETRRAPAEARRGPAGTTRAPVGDGDGDSDGDGDGDRKPLSRKRSGNEPPPPRFDEFWNAYDHKVGRKRAETAYAAALKKPGVTPDLLIAAAASYVAWVKSEGKHPQFTKHPTTWLHGEHWTDERAARMTRTQQHLALAQQLHAEEQGQMIPFPHIGEGR